MCFFFISVLFRFHNLPVARAIFASSMDLLHTHTQKTTPPPTLFEKNTPHTYRHYLCSQWICFAAYCILCPECVPQNTHTHTKQHTSNIHCLRPAAAASSDSYGGRCGSRGCRHFGCCGGDISDVQFVDSGRLWRCCGDDGQCRRHDE